MVMKKVSKRVVKEDSTTPDEAHTPWAFSGTLAVASLFNDNGYYVMSTTTDESKLKAEANNYLSSVYTDTEELNQASKEFFASKEKVINLDKLNPADFKDRLNESAEFNVGTLVEGDTDEAMLCVTKQTDKNKVVNLLAMYSMIENPEISGSNAVAYGEHIYDNSADTIVNITGLNSVLSNA